MPAELPSALLPLVERGEVRLGRPLELLWVRTRIIASLLAITAGTLWGTFHMVQRPFTWLTLALAVSIPISAVGMNLSYHAYFSHGACKTSRAFKILLAVLGAGNFRGPVIAWAAHHRRHHKYTDVPHQDPHTPWQFGKRPLALLRGLWWVFLGEKLTRVRTVSSAFAPDLLEDKDVAWLDATYDLWAVLWLVGPGLVSLALGAPPAEALLVTCVLGCMRAAAAYVTIAMLINGFCHLVGSRPFAATHEARNLTWLTLPTFGGSLHHNHHVFPSSLVVSLNGELDPFDLLYLGLEKLGLIWDVQRPAPAALLAKTRSLPSGGLTERVS